MPDVETDDEIKDRYALWGVAPAGDLIDVGVYQWIALEDGVEE